MADPFQRRYQVFVSSTKRDLESERAAVSEALQRADYIPAGMELFPSASKKSLSVIKQVIRESDYYVLIVGTRYGSTLPTGQSFTEFEYHFARRLKKHPIAFVPRLRRPSSSESKQKQAKLAAFARLLERQLNVSYYSGPGDLASKVLSSLAINVEEHPAFGWVRADSPSMVQVEYDLDRRVIFYKSLRESAQKSIFVFGIGMRRIVNDLESIANQLDAGRRIRMMCLDPSFIRRHRAQSLFNQFFVNQSIRLETTDFLSDIERSIGRLQEFIRSNHIRNAKGRIELRTYEFFPTTNMTCIDEETTQGRMVFDLIMQGNLRTTLPGLVSANPLFRRYLGLFNSYWDQGKVVARNSHD